MRESYKVTDELKKMCWRISLPRCFQNHFEFYISRFHEQTRALLYYFIISWFNILPPIHSRQLFPKCFLYKSFTNSLMIVQYFNRFAFRKAESLTTCINLFKAFKGVEGIVRRSWGKIENLRFNVLKSQSSSKYFSTQSLREHKILTRNPFCDVHQHN